MSQQQETVMPFAEASPSLQIKVLPHGEGLPLPAYASEQAAGMDVHAALDTPLTLEVGARVLVPTGFAMALPPGFEAQARPRSGLAIKHGITLLNSPGTIDADYRGEVKIILINHGQDPYTIQPGDRIAQLVIAPVHQARIIPVQELDETERGTGGFGSTGFKQAPVAAPQNADRNTPSSTPLSNPMIPKK